MIKAFDLFDLKERPTLESDEYKAWIEQKDLHSFLIRSAASDYVPIDLYSDKSSTLLRSFFIPNDEINLEEIKKKYSFESRSPYTWGQTSEGGKRIYKMFNDEEKYLEPICFRRSFDEKHSDEGREYLELSQKISLLLDLHYVPHKNAYCTYSDDGNGELIEVVKIIPNYDGDWYKKRCLLFKRDFLDFYLFITKSALIRWWDCTRGTGNGFNMWNNGIPDRELINTPDLYSNLHIEGIQSYSNGLQLIRCSKSESEMENFIENGFSFKEKKFETYIANDLHNKKVHEVSCDPEKLCNYFNMKDSTLPLDLSPAFFKPEVLVKYKRDRDKYDLQERSISCKNGWSLQTCDFNQETNQVHTYLKYLGHLPYEEQLHWKSFNENPKGGISKRAYETDFEGIFTTQKTEIGILKESMQELAKRHPNIWNSEKDLELLHLNFSNNSSEWGDDISNLYNIIIHKMNVGELKALYQKVLREPPNKDWGSIKLIESILKTKDEAIAQQVIKPLREMREIRTVTGGHLSSERKKHIEKAQKTHGSLRKHFENLIVETNQSIKIIGQYFSELKISQLKQEGSA